MDDRLTSRRTWWIASAIGLSVAIPAGLVFGAPLEIVVGMILVTPVMLGLVGGLLGTSQWLVMRRRVTSAWWWIVASSVGLSVGLTSGVVLVEQGGRALTGTPMRLANTGTVGLVLSMLVIGTLGGVCVGVAQWLYLRRHTNATLRWVLHTTAALAGGLLAGAVVAATIFGGVTDAGGLVVFLGVAGVVFGGITSRALPTARTGTSLDR